MSSSWGNRRIAVAQRFPTQKIVRTFVRKFLRKENTNKLKWSRYFFISLEIKEDRRNKASKICSNFCHKKHPKTTEMNLKHQKTKRIENIQKKKLFNKLQQTTRAAQKDIRKQQKLFERYQRKKYLENIKKLFFNLKITNKLLLPRTVGVSKLKSLKILWVTKYAESPLCQLFLTSFVK